MSLEKERTQNPWELITKPSIIDESNLKKNLLIIFIILLFSSSIGYLYGIFLEKKKGILFESEDIKSRLNFKLLDILSLDQSQSWVETSKLLAEDILLENRKEEVLLFYTGEISRKVVDEFAENLKANLDSNSPLDGRRNIRQEIKKDKIPPKNNFKNSHDPILEIFNEISKVSVTIGL